MDSPVLGAHSIPEFLLCMQFFSLFCYFNEFFMKKFCWLLKYRWCAVVALNKIYIVHGTVAGLFLFVCLQWVLALESRGRNATQLDAIVVEPKNRCMGKSFALFSIRLDFCKAHNITSTSKHTRVHSNMEKRARNKMFKHI